LVRAVCVSERRRQHLTAAWRAAEIHCANDYRRVYDVEHGRMYHQERATICSRSPITPGTISRCSASCSMGSVAYNIDAKGQPVRGGDARDRRMWMHTNPVVAIRAALRSCNTLSNRRDECA
jgi:hypothetical protein